MDVDAPRFARIAKALSEPRRLEILKLVSSNPGITCTEVVNSFELSQSTISHHIKELTDAGLIACAKDGQFSRLSSVPSMLQAFVDSLAPIAEV